MGRGFGGNVAVILVQEFQVQAFHRQQNNITEGKSLGLWRAYPPQAQGDHDLPIRGRRLARWPHRSTAAFLPVIPDLPGTFPDRNAHPAPPPIHVIACGAVITCGRCGQGDKQQQNHRRNAFGPPQGKAPLASDQPDGQRGSTRRAHEDNNYAVFRQRIQSVRRLRQHLQQDVVINDPPRRMNEKTVGGIPEENSQQPES